MNPMLDCHNMSQNQGLRNHSLCVFRILFCIGTVVIARALTLNFLCFILLITPRRRVKWQGVELGGTSLNSHIYYIAPSQSCILRIMETRATFVL